MQYVKKYWHVLIGLSLIIFVFGSIYRMPTGVISEAPPPQTANAAGKADTSLAPAKPKTTIEDNTFTTSDGKKVTWQRKTTEKDDGAQENIYEPTNLASFFSGVLSVVWGIFQIGLMLAVSWYVFRLIQNKASLPGMMNLAGSPGAAGGSAPSGTHFTKGHIAGAPAGADLSFLTIIQPEDNPVRLDHVILDKGLKKKLAKIASGLGEKKSLYETARAELVAEIEAKEKKKNEGWLSGSTTPFIPSVDMADAKVKKPNGGLFKSKTGKAFLFTGGPGVGKTLAATAIAGSAGVPIVVISGTLENTLLGGGAQRVDIVMSIAEKLGPCLIFVDEAENAAGQRDKGGQKMGATSDGTTAKWLAAIDGVRQKVDKDSEFMGPSDMIYFAMATNYVDMMDEAIKRSGRLKVINFPKPTVPLLQRMLQLFIGKKKLPLGPDIDPTFLAAATMLSGKTGADIEEIANSFAEYCEEEVERLSKALKKEGKSEEEVKAVIDSLRFGQQAFLFGVIDHLMGAKIEDDIADFNRDVNTTLHEIFHALAGAVAGHLGLSSDRMRLLCVSRRQRSLGVCFWSPAKGDRTNLSKRDVLGLVMIGYAGGAVQTLINFFKVSLGRELDFFTDSGASSNLSMCANLIKDNVALHNGSLNTGPISKGNNGRTYASEMGPDMVNEIDYEIRARQRLGYAIAHWICSALITSPVVWEMVEEVLISKDNLMVEDRFYTYFERLMNDENIRRQIEDALPTFIRQESEKAAGSPINYTWVPPQPAKEVRNFVIGQIKMLESKYDEFQQKLEAETLEETTAESEAHKHKGA